MRLIQLYAARQVVNARVTVYTDTDLQTLVWLGRFSEALDAARLREEREARYKGLMAIYLALEQRGRLDLMLLYEALDTADQIESTNTWVAARPRFPCCSLKRGIIRPPMK